MAHMDQELFEDTYKQYSLYGIEALREESASIGDPDSFPDGEVGEEAAAIMESLLAEHPDSALTFDDMSGLWIMGSEDAIARMFADRDEFVDSLEATQ